jgi:hypothetical protein
VEETWHGRGHPAGLQAATPSNGYGRQPHSRARPGVHDQSQRHRRRPVTRVRRRRPGRQPPHIAPPADDHHPRSRAAAPQKLYRTREHRDCQHASRAQDPEYTRNDPGRKREAVTTRPASGEPHQLRPAASGAVNVPARVSTGQKAIRGACDNFLHYELNANRALARETRGSSEAGARPAARIAAAEAAGATGVRVRTSRARRRADVVTPRVVAGAE